MLRRWARQTIGDHDVPAANVLHAHLAYMFKNFEASQLRPDVVQTLLSCQVFLTIHFRNDVEVHTKARARRRTAACASEPGLRPAAAAARHLDPGACVKHGGQESP